MEYTPANKRFQRCLTVASFVVGITSMDKPTAPVFSLKRKQYSRYVFSAPINVVHLIIFREIFSFTILKFLSIVDCGTNRYVNQVNESFPVRFSKKSVASRTDSQFFKRHCIVYCVTSSLPHARR